MERLRDRTDELELIISSLTIFALFSLPGWLFDAFSRVFTQLPTSLVIGGTVGLALVAGISYALAACFVVHLMARAYWVGLIGLRTVFPDGINWARTPGIGPLTRQYYQEKLPKLTVVIERTDRLASSLFAVISLLTLGFLWLGTILTGVVIAGGVIGARFGLTNAGIGVATWLLLGAFAGAPILVFMLDAVLAKRFAGLRGNRLFVGTVGFLRRIAGLAYPQRLVLPVQLTLQSNSRPLLFYLALVGSVVVIVLLGNLQLRAWQNFTLSGEYTYMTNEQISQSFRSSYYEDMPSSKDRLRSWPRIDSFNQTGSFVRLFLPYHPLRDNLVLDQICGGPADAPDSIDCLRQLWSVSIEGRSVAMSEFMPAQRADLGMRGLMGLVPLAGLEPGLRTITVVWRPDVDEDDAPIDDRYSQISDTFNIAIAFAPDYELSLESPAVP